MHLFLQQQKQHPAPAVERLTEILQETLREQVQRVRKK
jgi:hypothetical protein